MTNFKQPTKKKLKKDEKIFRKRFLSNAFSSVEPSEYDERDYTLEKVSSSKLNEFPEEYESKEVEILNQGSIGSCVAHALASNMMIGDEIIFDKHNNYSRGFIYANRLDTDHQGEGMITRQALSQLLKCGDVQYVDFPHNRYYAKVKQLLEANKDNLLNLASEYKIKDYFRCYSEDEIKETIMTRGAVIICVPVYTDFGRDLHVTKTNLKVGNHAMIIVGWTKEGKWIVQNSWGKSWGYDGKLLMDKDYPVREYWGITTKDNHNVREHKPFWKRLLDAIKEILQSILNSFKKNK